MSVRTEDLCMGLVVTRLFAGAAETPVAGRPALAQVVRDPALLVEPLAQLGIDSLAWLEALTSLENDLGVQVTDELLAADHVTVASLARAFALALRAEHHPVDIPS